VIGRQSRLYSSRGGPTAPSRESRSGVAKIHLEEVHGSGNNAGLGAFGALAPHPAGASLGTLRHGDSEDDLDCAGGAGDMPPQLTGVAAMISNVVNQSAHLTAGAAGHQPPGRPPGSRSFGKRNIKSQVRRFRMETKAAKTLGIIVGCFICCWFPFFTMYLVRAFCKDCINEMAFTVIFWLGYCNSAFNPFIYAMFSREFRGAFKKILYRVFCMGSRLEVPNHRGVFAAFNPRNMDVTLGAAAVASVGICQNNQSVTGAGSVHNVQQDSSDTATK